MVTNLIRLFLEVVIYSVKLMLRFSRTSSPRLADPVSLFPLNTLEMVHSPYRVPSLKRGVAKPDAWWLQRPGCRPVFICADGSSKLRTVSRSASGPGELPACTYRVTNQQVHCQPRSSRIFCGLHTGILPNGSAAVQFKMLLIKKQNCSKIDTFAV